MTTTDNIRVKCAPERIQVIRYRYNTWPPFLQTCLKARLVQGCITVLPSIATARTYIYFCPFWGRYRSKVENLCVFATFCHSANTCCSGDITFCLVDSCCILISLVLWIDQIDHLVSTSKLSIDDRWSIPIELLLMTLNINNKSRRLMLIFDFVHFGALWSISTSSHWFVQPLSPTSFPFLIFSNADSNLAKMLWDVALWMCAWHLHEMHVSHMQYLRVEKTACGSLGYDKLLG